MRAPFDLWDRERRQGIKLYVKRVFIMDDAEHTVLTVRAHQANSHQGRGWERFTDRIIELTAAKSMRVVFVLWGREAQKRRRLIT